MIVSILDVAWVSESQWLPNHQILWTPLSVWSVALLFFEAEISSWELNLTWMHHGPHSGSRHKWRRNNRTPLDCDCDLRTQARIVRKVDSSDRGSPLTLTVWRDHSMSCCWTVNTLKTCGRAFKGIIKSKSSLQRPRFFWSIDFFCLLYWYIILQVTAKEKKCKRLSGNPGGMGCVCVILRTWVRCPEIQLNSPV